MATSCEVVKRCLKIWLILLHEWLGYQGPGPLKKEIEYEGDSKNIKNKYRMLAYLRSRSICLCTKDIIGSSSSAVKSTCCEGKVATPGNAKSLVTVYALPCHLGRAVRRARERFGSLAMLLLLLISGFSVKTLSRSLVQKLSSRACLCWSLLVLRGQYSTLTERHRRFASIRIISCRTRKGLKNLCSTNYIRY